MDSKAVMCLDSLFFFLALYKTFTYLPTSFFPYFLIHCLKNRAILFLDRLEERL